MESQKTGGTCSFSFANQTPTSALLDNQRMATFISIFSTLWQHTKTVVLEKQAWIVNNLFEFFGTSQKLPSS